MIQNETYTEPKFNPVSNAWFFFVILFLIIDFGRPQDTIPGFGLIRPNLWLTIILTIFVLKNKYLIRYQTPQIKLIWIFILILALLTPLAVNYSSAFKTAFSMTLYMPFILSLSIAVNTIDRLKKTLNIILILMAFQAIWAFSHGGRGTGAFLRDENDLALFLCAWLPFGVAFFFYERKIIPKLLYLGSMAAGLCGIVASLSRGGFLGFLLMVVVFWMYSTKKVLTLFIFVIIGTVFFILAGASYWSEMSTSTNAEDETGKERIESWKSAINMFEHNPLGVGGSNFSVRFSQYQTSFFKRSMYGRVAHSLWFTLIPETGIGGIVVYFLLIFNNVKTTFGIRKKSAFLVNDDKAFFKNLTVAFFGSFAGFFGAATFVSVLYYPHFWYLTGILVAAYNISNKEKTCL